MYAVIGAIAGTADMGAAIKSVAGTTVAFAQKGERVRVHGEALLEIRLQRAGVSAGLFVIRTGDASVGTF